MKFRNYLEELKVNEIKKASEFKEDILDIFKKNKLEKIVKDWPFIDDIIFNRKALLTTFKKYSKKDLMKLIEKMYKKGAKSREIDEIGIENISKIGGKEAMADIIVTMITKENDYKDVLPFVKDILGSEEHLKRAMKGKKDVALASLIDQAERNGKIKI